MVKNLNIFRIILAVLILFIPLYPKFPLSFVSHTYVAIRLDDIIVAVSILIWGIYQLRHRLPFFRSRLGWLFTAYFLATALSQIVSLVIFQDTPANILLLHWARRVEYMLLAFIAIEAIKTPKDLKFPLIFLILSLIGIAIYGYGQKYLSFPVVSTMNSEFSKGQLLEMSNWTRISSTFAGHYDLAAFLSLILVLLLGAHFLLPLSASLLLLPITLISYHLLTLTASRISIMALWGGSILLLITIRRYFWIIPVSLIIIASIITSTDLNQRLLATIPSLTNQLFPSPIPTVAPTATPIPTSTKPQPTLKKQPTPIPVTPTIFRHQPEDEFPPLDADSGVARSGEIRFNVEWPRAINAFRKSRLTGTGLGSLTLATDNDYLRSLGESGILGLATILAIIVSLIIPSIKKITQPPTKILLLSRTFMAAIITMLANATFIDVFEASKVAYTFWIIVGLYYQTTRFVHKK